MMNMKEKEDKDKEKINQELLASGGILRDYDNQEILYPINLSLLDVLYNMRKIAQDNL